MKMILKGLTDYYDWVVYIGSHFTQPELSDDCWECKCFGYFYVYKNSNDFVKGSMYNQVLFNGNPIKHSELYKIITRVKKLERIIK